MLLQRLFDNLELSLQAFAVCEVAAGWRLRLGGLDWVTVHFVLSGSGRLRTAGGEIMVLPTGSLALVPAKRAHVIEIGDPVEHESEVADPILRGGSLRRFEAGPRATGELIVACGRIQARYGAGLGLFDHLEEPIVLDFSDSTQMKAIFGRLLDEEGQRSATSGPMMTALMNEALILLFRRLCEDPECPLPWLTALEDPRLSPALSLILEHPEQPHTLDSLAKAATMSRSSFADAFTETIGRPPMTYLREARLRKAAGLLRVTTLPIDQIAVRVGYASRSQFSHAFSSQFGGSPSAFRRRDEGATTIPAGEVAAAR